MSAHLRVLVVGSGGREHALAWALSRCASVDKVFVAPGNAGTEWPGNPAPVALQPRAESSNVPIAASDIPQLIRFAQSSTVDLTVIGPEAPLAAGIVDAFCDAGLSAFGPTRGAAQLEWSKAFAKDFMRAQGIPTAAYGTFDDATAARDFGRSLSGGVVVKADGLAAGKGVMVCDTSDETAHAIDSILVNREFGDAGAHVIVEERLRGPEVSAFAITDGEQIIMLPFARDHKRLLDGDAGPNTGGMGAFSPVVDVTMETAKFVRERVFEPAIAGMAARGTPYTGVLFAGLMLTDDGPKVLEFNCRFGDPETQCILPLIEDDLAEVFAACAAGKLKDAPEITIKPDACATVIAASGNYPGPCREKNEIRGLDLSATDDAIVFHSATADKDGSIVTAGGRILSVTGRGPTLDDALRVAYRRLGAISFHGMQYRRDIGAK